jgi:predicted  nucleic acid-binding Zn-ribbon protein
MDESIAGFAHLQREIGNRAQENQQVAEHISALEHEWQAWQEENEEHNQGEGEAKQALWDGLNAMRDSVEGIASGLGQMQTERLLGRNTPESRGGEYEGIGRRIAELEAGVRNLCQDVGIHMHNSNSDVLAVQALQGTQGKAEEKIAGLWTRALEMEAEIRQLQNEIQTLHQNQKEIVAEIGKIREELQHLHHTAARQEQARGQLHQETGRGMETLARGIQGIEREMRNWQAGQQRDRDEFTRQIMNHWENALSIRDARLGAVEETIAAWEGEESVEDQNDQYLRDGPVTTRPVGIYPTSTTEVYRRPIQNSITERPQVQPGRDLSIKFPGATELGVRSSDRGLLGGLPSRFRPEIVAKGGGLDQAGLMRGFVSRFTGGENFPTLPVPKIQPGDSTRAARRLAPPSWHHRQ